MGEHCSVSDKACQHQACRHAIAMCVFTASAVTKNGGDKMNAIYMDNPEKGIIQGVGAWKVSGKTRQRVCLGICGIRQRYIWVRRHIILWHGQGVFIGLKFYVILFQDVFRI